MDRAAAIDDLAAIVVLGRALAARPVGEALVGREVVGVIGGEADGFDDFPRPLVGRSARAAVRTAPDVGGFDVDDGFGVAGQRGGAVGGGGRGAPGVLAREGGVGGRGGEGGV